MNIMQEVDDLRHRALSGQLRAHLDAMPVVIVTGARQAGKTTLARSFAPGPRRFLSLDELQVLDAAERDPDSLFGVDEAVTVDEVQRAPRLLTAMKRRVDDNRQRGQFLVTGSANLALMARVSESLAGRASYLTLWPMTRGELRGTGCAGRWDALLATPDAAWGDLLADAPGEPADWRAVAERGGYPEPALRYDESAGRRIWLDGYIRTYLERDLTQLSSVASLVDYRRLMRAVCLRIGQVANQTEIARDIGLTQPTVHRYLNLLETSYLLHRLPAFARNAGKRLVKSPKFYWSDTALALRLADAAPTPVHLENLVLCDLVAWRDARPDPAEISYWRTDRGAEVDFVIEAGGKLVPVEIKSAVRPRLRDTTHLRAFRRDYPSQARAGLLLHAGERTEWLAPDVLATPWWNVV